MVANDLYNISVLQWQLIVAHWPPVYPTAIIKSLTVSNLYRSFTLTWTHFTTITLMFHMNHANANGVSYQNSILIK